ncbi:hypothetical protein ACIBKY_51210 [Nonomuraea sp. NPDC050394]|uniref:hypothetical protein n=1 Tax=Nonomuraea sp. NPDC050394 TaxID=3364363 RepID=UPI0037A32657
MSINVNQDQPTPEQVFHHVTPEGITLALGTHRISVNPRDPQDLGDGLLLMQKLIAVADAVRRDIINALDGVQAAVEQRALAAAHAGVPAAAPSASAGLRLAEPPLAGCGCSEFGPCPSHNPGGDDTRDLTGLIPPIPSPQDHHR